MALDYYQQSHAQNNPTQSGKKVEYGSQQLNAKYVNTNLI